MLKGVGKVLNLQIFGESGWKDMPEFLLAYCSLPSSLECYLASWWLPDANGLSREGSFVDLY